MFLITAISFRITLKTTWTKFTLVDRTFQKYSFVNSSFATQTKNIITFTVKTFDVSERKSVPFFFQAGSHFQPNLTKPYI
jgi:hypothetical protein